MMNVKYLKNPKTKEKFYPITKSDCIIDAFSINALEIDRLFEDSLSVSNHLKGMSYLNLLGLLHYHSKIADYLNNTISKIPSIYLTGYATEDWVKENSLYKIYENTSIEEVKSLLGDSVKVGTIVAIVDENSITEYQWLIVEKLQCAKITDSEKDSYFIVVRDPSLDKGDGTEAWVYKESGKLWDNIQPGKLVVEWATINYYMDRYTETIYDFKLKGFKYSGVLNSFAVGNTSIANGQDSIASGFETVAGGNASSAEGKNSMAGGEASHSEGAFTKAIGPFSHAEGHITSADGLCSHAEGASTTAGGVNSHAEGWGTTASGNQSHAEGNQTIASAPQAHAEGWGTQAAANGAHAEGDSTIAYAPYSHAEGANSKTGYDVNGDKPTSNSLTTPSNTGDDKGGYAHAEGGATLAIGKAAHAEGWLTFAQGNYSHAEGEKTLALGDFSHAEGLGNIASNRAQHVSGLYATVDETGNVIFLVGIGRLESVDSQEEEIYRKDALRINTDGNITILVNDAEVSLQDAIDYPIYTNKTLDEIKALYQDSSFVGQKTIGILENNTITDYLLQSETYESHNGIMYTKGESSYAHLWDILRVPQKDVDGKLAWLFSPYNDVTYSDEKGVIYDGDITITISDEISKYVTLIHLTPKNVETVKSLLSKIITIEDKLDGYTYNPENKSFSVGDGTATAPFAFACGKGTIASGDHSHAEGQFTSTITSFQVSQLSTELQTILANKYGISANCMSVSDKLPEGILGDIYSDPECTNFIAKVTLNFYCNEVGGTDIICIDGSELLSGVTYYFKGKSGAFGQAAHSEGYNTSAVADNSHAEGSETSAHGIGSHAEGGFTLANGLYAHAEGAGTAASGRRSHAEGIYSVSAGEGSHAEGVKTEAKNYSEHAEGQFNLSNKQSTTYGNALNTQHSVGIGTGYTARKNAFEIMQNGDVYLIGIGGYNGTNPSTSKTLQQSISAVATIDDSTESATSTYSSKKIGELIADGKFSIKSVNTLPETGAARTIYLLPSTADDGTHDEYLYIDDKWELIGNTKTDLSNYYSKAETDTLLLNKLAAITWGSNIVVKNGVVNSKDTTYSNVSTSESGLMSSSDKIKLDSLSNYTLPQATTSVLGGIKVDGDIFTINENGVIQAAKLLSSIEELNNQLSLLEAAKPSMIIYETVDLQPINIDKTYLTEANVYKHENNNILFDAKIRNVWKQSFLNNLNLSNITISKDSNYIGLSAFLNCSKLQSVQGVDNIKGIQDSAFLGCSMLMLLPTSDILTNIGESAFKNCISLSNIILPNSLKTIGTSAFEGCTSLNSLTIGNNVTDIYMSAFKDCTNLTEVTIPDSVLTLGTTVFQNCTSLNSITFGSGLTNIAGGVINGCSALKTITCKAATPPAMNGGNYLTSVTVVYVPESSLNAYKSASQWSSYASVMVAY